MATLKVIKGTVVFEGNNVALGEVFECDSKIAESLIKANVVEVVEETKETEPVVETEEVVEAVEETKAPKKTKK